MDDLKKKQFDTDMGQKAKVDRKDIVNELSAKGNAILRDVGTMLNPMPEHLRYLGSMSTHVYQSEMLGQIFFMGQTSTLGETPEATASAALTNLRGDVQEFYGRNRQKKRSGF